MPIIEIQKGEEGERRGKDSDSKFFPSLWMSLQYRFNIHNIPNQEECQDNPHKNIMIKLVKVKIKEKIINRHINFCIIVKGAMVRITANVLTETLEGRKHGYVLNKLKACNLQS